MSIDLGNVYQEQNHQANVTVGTPQSIDYQGVEDVFKGDEQGLIKQPGENTSEEIDQEKQHENAEKKHQMIFGIVPNALGKSQRKNLLKMNLSTS